MSCVCFYRFLLKKLTDGTGGPNKIGGGSSLPVTAGAAIVFCAASVVVVPLVVVMTVGAAPVEIFVLEATSTVGTPTGTVAPFTVRPALVRTVAATSAALAAQTAKHIEIMIRLIRLLQSPYYGAVYGIPSMKINKRTTTFVLGAYSPPNLPPLLTVIWQTTPVQYKVKVSPSSIQLFT